MKKIFLIVLLFFVGQMSYASELSEFGGLLGASLCADSANENVISACYWEGSVAGSFLDDTLTVCNSSYALLDGVQKRIQKNGLGTYVTLSGQQRALRMAGSLCGINGDLHLNEGRGYFKLTRDYVLMNGGETPQPSGHTPAVSTKEGVVLKIIVELIKEIAAKTLNESGQRLESELHPERVKAQLEQWLTAPKESLCRGDFTSGDLGNVFGKIVGCE